MNPAPLVPAHVSHLKNLLALEMIDAAASQFGYLLVLGVWN
jgi:hypothetical protein